MQEGNNEQTKQKAVWTKQERKKYLEVVALHLPPFKGRNQNFINFIMDKVGDTKTFQQCYYFHSTQKRGCSSLEQLIIKVAKSINEDPSLYIKSPEQAEKIKKEKKRYFEDLENIKAIVQIVVEEFTKEFNPFQIIFKPDKASLDQLMLTQKSNEIFPSEEDSKLIRPLDAKIYPAKELIYSSEEDDKDQKSDMLQESETQKKRILDFKRQVKNQQKQIKKSPAWQIWKDAQLLKMLVFLMCYRNQFQIQSLKRNPAGIFIKMGKFLKSRNQQLCKAQFHKLRIKYQNIDGIIENFQNNLQVVQQQIEEEIRNIQTFFQSDLDKQMNALNPVRFSFWFPGTSNVNLIKQVIKKQIESAESKQKQIKDKIKVEQQKMGVGNNEEIKIQLPIIFEVTLVKQLTEDQQKSEQNRLEQENADRCNSKKIKTNVMKKRSRLSKNQQIYQSEEQCLNSDENLSQIGQIQKKPQKWSASQNIKFISYLMVNRYFYEKAQSKTKINFLTQLSTFIHTNRDFTNCKEHFNEWKYRFNKDPNTALELKAEKYGITKSMIEERKRICRQIQTVSTQIGNATLDLDHLPEKFRIKNKNFSEQAVLKSIYEAQPYLSFYLRFQKNASSNVKNQLEQKKKNQKEEGQELKEKHHSEIMTSINLAVPQQKFQDLRKSLLQDFSINETNIFSCTSDKICVKMKIKLAYHFTLQND